MLPKICIATQSGDSKWISSDKSRKKVHILRGQVDAVMIGRAAIGYPFIFREVKYFLETGNEPTATSIDERFKLLLEHLNLDIKYKGLVRGLREFRKNYTGYLKGLYDSHKIRQKLVTMDSYEEVVETLNGFKENYLKE